MKRAIVVCLGVLMIVGLTLHTYAEVLPGWPPALRGQPPGGPNRYQFYKELGELRQWYQGEKTKRLEPYKEQIEDLNTERKEALKALREEFLDDLKEALRGKNFSEIGGLIKDYLAGTRAINQVYDEKIKEITEPALAGLNEEYKNKATELWHKYFGQNSEPPAWVTEPPKDYGRRGWYDRLGWWDGRKEPFPREPFPFPPKPNPSHNPRVDEMVRHFKDLEPGMTLQTSDGWIVEKNKDGNGFIKGHGYEIEFDSNGNMIKYLLTEPVGPIIVPGDGQILIDNGPIVMPVPDGRIPIDNGPIVMPVPENGNKPIRFVPNMGGSRNSNLDRLLGK